MNDLTHNLTIGHCNIQGGFLGVGKSNEIAQLIRVQEIDVLSLNETNLNDSIDTDTLNIPMGYDFIRKDRGVGSRGGCGILINRKCAYKQYDMKTNLDNIEAVWVKGIVRFWSSENKFWLFWGYCVY